MKAKHVYYPATTPQQRKHLFEMWEQSANVTWACQKAHVGRATFYYWKARFDQEGYAGLEAYAQKGVPKGTGRVAAEVEAKVLELHDQHADWGKHRVTHEIAKSNNWVPLVSPNSVRRILEDAGLWQPEEKQVKKSPIEPVSRTADRPGQTLKVDLLFVPACHLADVKLPAVSGSSGHLVIERIQAVGPAAEYPGRVFEDPDLEYAEAVQAFVAASQPISKSGKGTIENKAQPTEIQQLRQAETQLCNERRDLRKLRELEDATWQVVWEQQRDEKPSDPKRVPPTVRARWGARKPHEEERKSLRADRRAQMKQRQPQDEQWRLTRKSLREKMSSLPMVTAWIAILLVTDNCSRQCLGLPLFMAGSHVTAEMVVAALRVLLPANLQFVISDRGTHFTAQAFLQLASDVNFLHVVIARHRPQSNGIAERFVRTLKEWLADKAWSSDKDLLEFLHLFLL